MALKQTIEDTLSLPYIKGEDRARLLVEWYVDFCSRIKPHDQSLEEFSGLEINRVKETTSKN